MERFVSGRFSPFINALPPKPIRVCVDIVNAAWKPMDAKAQPTTASTVHIPHIRGNHEVYWLEVMMQNGWETVLA